MTLLKNVDLKRETFARLYLEGTVCSAGKSWDQKTVRSEQSTKIC